MIKRLSKVVLQAGDRKEEFDIEHAERILKMPNNGGWRLPDDSPLQMTRLNGLINRRHKGDTKKPEKQ